MRSFDDLRYATSVLVCGSQMGKTEAVTDVIGERLDTRPVPTLYVGPSQRFIDDEFEPRLMAMFNQSASLARKLARGKRNKLYRKLVGGVPIRLAWAGSPSQLAAMSAGLMVIDEYDRMLADVKGEGDPLGLTKARGFTYRDRRYGVTSTPLVGNVEVAKCRRTGLEFWKRMPTDDIESAIWKLFQQGTMHHFAWPCPECKTFFIPRFRNLKWPKAIMVRRRGDHDPALHCYHGDADAEVKRLRASESDAEFTVRDASAAEAKREAHLECPNCGGVIREESKREMLDRGVYVAPGQAVGPDGTVVGDPPDTLTVSFWVSGLCSPFVTFGERAQNFVEAQESGEPGQIQSAINTGMGELWAQGGGEAPEWSEVARNRIPLEPRVLPSWARQLTMGVDVQKDRLVYSIRAWGARATSVMLDFGDLWGETHQEDVWLDFQDLLQDPIDGAPIRLALIDSGFRPGKPFDVPVNRVYEFCRRMGRVVRPTKGRAKAVKPIAKSQIEVTARADQQKYGLELLLLDTDHWKSWVHERVRWPHEKPGAWLLNEEATEEYCRAIVSESRLRKPSGQIQWVARSRNNHLLDCEALNAAAGYMLNAHKWRGEVPALTDEDNVGDDVEAVSRGDDRPLASRQTTLPTVPKKRLSAAEVARMFRG